MPTHSRTATKRADTRLDGSWRKLTALRLQQAVDVALVSVLAFAPLFMGGRDPIGKLVFVSLVSLAAVGWGIRQCLLRDAKWRWSGAELLILLGILLAVLQILPLPLALLDAVSPSISELLPLWRGEAESAAHVGTWSTISLVPAETRSGLGVFMSYALLFMLFFQRFESLDDVEQGMKWLASAVLLMAGIGMMQFLFGNGKFLWVYEHPSRDTLGKVIGTFQNQNHFAHFLALGVGPLIWWITRRASSRRRTEGKFDPRSPRNKPLFGSYLVPALSVGFGLVILAGSLTFSRGGIVSLAAATGLTVLLFVWKGFLGRKSLVAALGLGATLCVALTIYGSERLSARMGTLASGSLGEVARVRIDLWRAQWKAIPRFAAFGAGIGSHRAVYPVYMEEHHDVDFAFGENGYFQLLLETGFAGLAILLTGFGLALRHCLAPLMAFGTNPRLLALSASIVPGIVVSLVHSLADFVWYIPACVSSTLLLLAGACRVHHLARMENSEGPFEVDLPLAGTRSNHVPLNALAFTSVALVCSVASIQLHFGAACASPHWDSYLRLALGPQPSTTSSQSERRDHVDRIERTLVDVLRRDAGNARAQLTMASVKLQQFDLQQQTAENPLVLSQIRDAALASSFPSKAAQDAWLSVAIGKNRALLDEALLHSRAALTLSPLQGLGYIYLAELSFLDNPRPDAKVELVQQATRVRPFSGRVLFGMGQELALSGDLAQAIQLWRRAFRQDPEVKQLIVDSLAGQLPAELFLKSFHPDAQGLRMLYAYYRQHGLDEEARHVATPLIVAVEQELGSAAPIPAAHAWTELQIVHAWMGNSRGALECAHKAVMSAPHHVEYRKNLAGLLAQAGKYGDAIQHLEWCIRRHPQDRELISQLSDIRLRHAQLLPRLQATGVNSSSRSDF